MRALLTKSQQRAVAKAWARNIKKREDAAARERSEHLSPPSSESEGSRDEPNQGRRSGG